MHRKYRYKKAQKTKAALSWRDYTQIHTAGELKNEIKKNKVQIDNYKNKLEELIRGNETFKRLNAELFKFPELPRKYRTEGGIFGFFSKTVKIDNTSEELQTEKEKHKVWGERDKYRRYENIYVVEADIKSNINRLESTVRSQQKAYKTKRKENQKLLESDLSELEEYLNVQSNIIDGKASYLTEKNSKYAKEFFAYNEEEREDWIRNKTHWDDLVASGGSVSWGFEDENGNLTTSPSKEQLEYFHFSRSADIEIYFLEKNKLSHIKAEIRSIEKQLHQLVRIRLRHEKKELDQAILIRAKESSRQDGVRIKKGLIATKTCPYCTNDFGNNPHADHIYPIALGGLSVEANMIYVCGACNLKKSSLTLLQFCMKYNRDYQEITKRLITFGKTV